MKRGWIHISFAGPTRTIMIDGKAIKFEMHRYCGPSMLNKRGDPLAHQPVWFLEAASRWCQQGEKIENGLCVYDPAIPLK